MARFRQDNVRLDKGWAWVLDGKTNPKTDHHCWPRWSGNELVPIKTSFEVTPAICGMVLRYRTPAFFVQQPNVGHLVKSTVKRCRVCGR